MRSGLSTRWILAASAAVLIHVATAASAQELSRVSLDSVGAVDLFRGDGTTGNPGGSVDISSVVRIGRGWSAHLRPWFFKSASNGSAWNREIYQAAMRYERAGRTSVRLDAGLIASPIGLGMLDMRADINPTIQPHLSYMVSLLPFDAGAPGVRSIAASYPLGANLTMSTARWDARAALVSSAPGRRYAFNSRTPNPDATPVVVTGAGIVLVPGSRVGASFARGRYATAAELKDPSGADRQFQMWTAEGEYAFGYTKIAGEVTRTRFHRGAASDTAASWFVQGVHTLAPRWFVAGRHEAISAPPRAASGPEAPRLSFRTAEGSVGYRVTPELTLRASVATVRGYTATAADRRVGLQVVWSRRWW